jgi:hypothetical protein
MALSVNQKTNTPFAGKKCWKTALILAVELCRRTTKRLTARLHFQFPLGINQVRFKRDKVMKIPPGRVEAKPQILLRLDR